MGWFQNHISYKQKRQYMEIEIVEFYPEPNTKKGEKCGTLHVYLTNIGMDIRGIRCIKTKRGWVTLMPHKQGWEDGKRVFYPVVSFTDIEIMKKLLLQIKEKGIAYIKENTK